MVVNLNSLFEKSITMYKITVLYHHPTDSSHFESYYFDKHLKFAKLLPELLEFKHTKFENGSDGSLPAFYRMAELYFASRPVMEEAMASPEGQTLIDDLLNFASGGVSFMLSPKEEPLAM